MLFIHLNQFYIVMLYIIGKYMVQRIIVQVCAVICSFKENGEVFLRFQMYILLARRARQLSQPSGSSQGRCLYVALPPRDPPRDPLRHSHGEEKLDTKINSYYLNIDKQLTKIHRDIRNKAFEYKNDIVLEFFYFKMSKYVLS